jgi:hypothetical protein
MRWRKPTSDDIVPGVSEEKLIHAARDYVSSAFPNPDRVGCPGRKRLEAFARQTSALDENDLDHLMTCSDCFIEYHAILKARKQKRAATIGTLIAATLALIVFSGVVISRHHTETPPIIPVKQPVEVAQESNRTALIDLRPFERIRGDAANNPRNSLSPPVLDRAKLLVTIQLPTGSPEGQYVFQLLDSNGSPVAETSGKAAIKDYVTMAEAPFDLRAVSAGRFTLTVRRAVESAFAAYTVEVR